MGWANVIDQERVKEVLRSSLEQDRVSHAYLFYGPYGVGKRATAIAFAKALLCHMGGADPCGECPNCSRIDRMMHPDVRFFYPSPRDTPLDDIAERIVELGRNPYRTLDFVRRPTAKGGNKQVRYPVTFVREEIKPIVDFKSFEGRYKVMVILGAEAMGAEAGNAFLKMLEEPSGRTVFVLVSERPDQLLPTISSRCQPVRFDPLTAESIEQALINHEGLAPGLAGPLSRMADGSYSIAIDLVSDEQARAFRESLLPFLRSVYTNDTFDIVMRVEELTSQSLDQIKLFLTLLMGLIRDLILVRELGPDAHVVNVDVRETLERFCDGLPDARLGQMVELVEEAIRLVSRNVRVQLVLMALAAGLRRSMKGMTALPLTTPLADQLVIDTDE